MSGSITVGTNDYGDNTGDLILSFVDIGRAITTDGSRSALPGQPWGCYLIAPSISPQAGCVVTWAAGGTAQWLSCSLIYEPPPHAASYWPMGGEMDGAGAVAVAPKWPPTTWPLAGEIDASGGLGARANARAALIGETDAAGGLAGRSTARLLGSAALQGAGAVAGAVSGPGAAAWQIAGNTGAVASIAGRIVVQQAITGTIAPGAGTIAALSTSAHQYAIGGLIAGAASIGGNPATGHRYTSGASVTAAASIIPFGGIAPVRVTNWVRNPRPDGVVTGIASNGGPPNWWLLYQSPDSNLAVNIIGTGTDSGIPYMDVEFSSAAPALGTAYVQADQFIPVSSGKTWSYGMFLGRSAGSLSNITVQLCILSDGTGGTHLGPTITPAGGALSGQWYSYAGVTISDAGMTNIAPGFAINITTAAAVDVTLRLGSPTLEQAATNAGPQYQAIPTVGNSPTADGATRSYVY